MDHETYLSLCILPFERVVDEPSVDYRHEGMALDVRRKVKMPMGLLDVPLLLEFGGRFTIICGRENSKVRTHGAQSMGGISRHSKPDGSGCRLRSHTNAVDRM